jgi:protein TonB
MAPTLKPKPRCLAALIGCLAVLLASCSSGLRNLTPPTAEERAQDAAGVFGPVAGNRGSARASSATTERAYRQDGASHLYGLNAARIYKGQLPPLLYAIGTLQVQLDAAGRVTGMSWMRAPRHAPEVVAEIEATVRRASPFPAPTRIGRMTYTDTWLWDKSGRFQLDTLTEGQR